MKELTIIRLNESGKSFHGIPAEKGNIIVTEEPLAEEYDDVGVLVVAPRILHVAGSEGTVWFGAHALVPGDTNKLQYAHTMREIQQEGLPDVMDAVTERVGQWPRCHVVLDLAIIDPAFAPGLTTKYVGGLSTRELLYVVQRLARMKSLHSAELIVGGKDDEITAKLLAKILAELL